MSLKRLEQKILRRARLFEEVQSACKKLLRTHPGAQMARDYVNERISLDNQDKFDVGYFPDEEHLNYITDLVELDKLKELDLIYPYHVQNGDHRVFINKTPLGLNNVTIPYRDFRGNIVALVGRTILPEDERKALKLSKYKYTRFKKSLQLFGLHQAKQAILRKRSVIVVEGQIDCITCHQYGIDNVVALGGSSLTKRQFETISWLAENIYLLLDNDPEGIKAQEKIIHQYSKDITVKKLRLPEKYKDVDECLRRGYNASSILETI